jgi:hypothetical protein
MLKAYNKVALEVPAWAVEVGLVGRPLDRLGALAAFADTCTLLNQAASGDCLSSARPIIIEEPPGVELSFTTQEIIDDWLRAGAFSLKQRCIVVDGNHRVFALQQAQSREAGLEEQRWGSSADLLRPANRHGHNHALPRLSGMLPVVVHPCFAEHEHKEALREPDPVKRAQMLEAVYQLKTAHYADMTSSCNADLPEAIEESAEVQLLHVQAVCAGKQRYSSMLDAQKLSLVVQVAPQLARLPEKSAQHISLKQSTQVKLRLVEVLSPQVLRAHHYQASFLYLTAAERALFSKIEPRWSILAYLRDKDNNKPKVTPIFQNAAAKTPPLVLQHTTAWLQEALVLRTSVIMRWRTPKLPRGDAVYCKNLQWNCKNGGATVVSDALPFGRPLAVLCSTAAILKGLHAQGLPAVVDGSSFLSDQW